MTIPNVANEIGRIYMRRNVIKEGWGGVWCVPISPNRGMCSDYTIPIYKEWIKAKSFRGS